MSQLAFVDLIINVIQFFSIASSTCAGKLSFSSCTQSSKHMDASCTKAYDSEGPASVTHTKMESAPWWTGRLTSKSLITYVTIFNRKDCCQNRLTDFVIEVDGQQCASYKSDDFFMSKTFTCNAFGSSVTIRSRKKTYLSLSDVIVYGKKVIRRE
jgi:hypothetical protein